MAIRSLFAALLIGGFATPAPAQPAPTAQSLIERNLDARGGAAALAAIKAISFEGRTLFPGDFEVGYSEARSIAGGGAAELSANAPADVKTAAAQLLGKADALRKEIVATTEGGAITGEERLRENVDEIYGAINSVEDRPTNYQMARIDALDRELKEVEAQWAAFQSADLAAFYAKLKAARLPPLTIAEVEFDIDAMPRGGRAETLVRGLVGMRFYGDFGAFEETGEKD